MALAFPHGSSVSNGTYASTSGPFGASHSLCLIFKQRNSFCDGETVLAGLSERLYQPPVMHVYRDFSRIILTTRDFGLSPEVWRELRVGANPT